MNNIRVFLKELKGQGVEIILSGDGNNLEINYKDNLSEIIINQIREEKKEIIDYLNSFSQVIPKVDYSNTGYPLTPSQKRAWILSQIDGYNFAYNMYEVLVFEGELNVEKLEQAFIDLINAHEILRTIFKEDDKGEVWQFVKNTEELNFAIETIDLKKEPDAEEKIKTLVLSEIKVLFKLLSGPLIKCKLYQISKNKWICLFVIHHVICDSRSFDVLKRDLLLAYNARVNGTKGLVPLEIQYKDFAVWKDFNLKGEGIKAQREYWLKQFEGELPVLELPIDKKRPAQRMVEAGIIKRRIDKDLTKNFKQYCVNQGATFFTGLMSLFNLLFYKYTNQTDIILGFPMYGREYTELENLIGFFADTLALRTRFKKENSFEELLNNVNKRAFEAYEHKDYPFEELITEINPIRDSSRTIFFDVFIVLQNFEHATVKEKAVNFGNLKVSEFKGENTRYSAFDLVINCSESEEGLTYAIEYNRSVFNDSTIERLANHMELLMDIVLKNSKSPLYEIDFLTHTEKQQVLEFGGAIKKGETPITINENNTLKEKKGQEEQDLDFSLFYFGNKGTEKNNYQLLIEGAKYADANNYCAVWTPERHFNEFGGPYPNPSVLGASLATITENISIRSGSIVTPLHHPIRIVEEWSVVDNLSNGRVGMCLASGWNANDFILIPENYEKRHELLYENIHEIKELWKGNSVSYKNANNEDTLISTLPRPIQESVPMWIASGGSIETFKKAGEIGAGILTGLLNTTFEELAEKIKIYRQSYADHNHPIGKDTIVLMLHTYIEEDLETARNMARGPMSDYLFQSVSMSKKQTQGAELNTIANDVTQEDIAELLSYTVEKYFDRYSLIGTKESCIKILNDVKNAGVDEVACLIDFGIDYKNVMNGLKHLTGLKDVFNKKNLHKNEIKVPVLSQNKTVNLKSIINVFQEQVLRTPNHIAVRFNSDSLTYKQLDEKSNQVAHCLIHNNVQPKEAVALYLDRSLEMIIGMLGIMKSGAVYVPIDILYPKARIEYMLKDCGAKYILSQQSYINTLSNYKDLKTVAIEEAMEAHVPIGQINLPEQLSDNAYIIYTSGSTGKPKGVPITHYNLSAFFESTKEIFGEKEQQICSPILTSNAFDIYFFETLYPLLNGGTSIMIAREDIQNIDVLLEKLRNVNAFHVVPALMAQILIHIKNTKTEADYSMITDIYIGGDIVPSNTLIEMKNRFSNADIHVLYGPTESTIFVTTHTIEKINKNVNTQLRGSIIGKPNPNIQLYILNNELQLNSVGIVGEICIGGPTIANEYLNKLDESKEKFIENPFIKGEKIYKTGDLGRWLVDGTIKFMGRKDNQVKIKGYRIELGEIEHALTSISAVKEAVVVAKTLSNTNDELVAYLVSDDKMEAKSLRNLLQKTLANYMIPAYFIQLKELPLTANGKIDIKALPNPEHSDLKNQETYVSPRNEIEEIIVDVYQEVLRKEKIGIQDDFFIMGGDSIKSIQIVARLIQRNLSLTIQDILLNPVVEDLARFVKKVDRLISQKTVKEEVGLSPIQSYFFENHPINHHHFNQSILLFNSEGIKEEGVRKVFDKIMQQHDALRMTYHKSTSNGWIQKNQGEELTYDLQQWDYNDLNSFHKRCEQLQSSITINEGSLLKLGLFKGVNGDHLLIAIHHLVIDAVSWEILLKDLEILFKQYVLGETLKLPLKTDSFINWQKQLLLYSKSNTLDKEHFYWASVNRMTMNKIPLDKDNGDNFIKNRSTQSYILNRELTDVLLTKCNKGYGTVTNEILLTSCVTAIKKTFNIQNVAIWMEGHGRENIDVDIDISRTVGWFTSMFPVIFNSTEGNNILELISVKDTLRRVPNKGIGYGILKYLGSKEYTLSPEISFNYLGNYTDSIVKKQDPSLFKIMDQYKGKESSLEMKREHLLEIQAIISEGCVHVDISYSQDQFHDETIEEIIAQCKNNLIGLIEELSMAKEVHTTPSDYTFKGLSIEELEQLKNL